MSTMYAVYINKRVLRFFETASDAADYVKKFNYARYFKTAGFTYTRYKELATTDSERLIKAYVDGYFFADKTYYKLGYGEVRKNDADSEDTQYFTRFTNVNCPQYVVLP